MNRKIWISALTAALLVNVAGWTLYSFMGTEKKYAFVDVIRLVDSYQLKKDLEKDLHRRMTPAKNQLDSLQFQSGLMSSKPADPIHQYYQQAAYGYQQAAQEADAKLSHQVWDRLNPVIMDFSRENNLKLLVGATGTGTLLYGDSTLDMTSALISYANNKYASH
jgi:outer membrane protein